MPPFFTKSAPIDFRRRLPPSHHPSSDISPDIRLANIMAEPSLPETYKAVVIDEKNGPLTLKELPLQRPKQGELLVKVLATGVCFSDANVQRGHMGDVL